MDYWNVNLLVILRLDSIQNIRRIRFIQNSNYDFIQATDQIRFPTNSKSSKEYEDFVLQLLKKDPRERLTADILLSHPFIIKYKKVEVCE